MIDINFVDRVKRHFSFLESELGFRITLESSSDLRPETDGMVEYTSDHTVVVIDSEIGSAAVWFYRTKDGRSYDLDPVAIDEYLNTNDSEKELLLSSNPKDSTAATLLFDQKFLLSQPEWKAVTNVVQEKLEKRLGDYANWLKSHANLCLQGDFSWWPKLYGYKVNRARADHLRLGKDEPGYMPVKDADGHWQLMKQSIFKDKLDHVEKLKRELQRGQ